MATKYKLTMVDRTPQLLPSKETLHFIQEKEISCIGYFESEEDLKQWAERNEGELAKAEGTTE